MVKRLLTVLEFPQSDNININDESTFRKLILWLETNKIKQAQSSTLNLLKSITANNWPDGFDQYLKELEAPNFVNNIEKLQWLLGLAVQKQTHEKRDVYLKYAVGNIERTTEPSVVAQNPLDKLNFRSEEFADGLANLAKLLKIVPHPDPLITLKAVSKLVSERLSPQALENPNDVIIKGTPFAFQDTDSGFDLKDPVLNQAAKVLRLLYIHDLRELQTRANELIVACQNITANPKTDTKLGKVGK